MPIPKIKEHKARLCMALKPVSIRDCGKGLEITCEETGELSERPFCIAEPAPIEKSARLHVANETREEITGRVEWELCKPDSTVLLSGREEVTVPALDGVWLDQLNFNEYDEREIHLSYRFVSGGKVVSSNSCLFTPPKHYYFEDPHLSAERKGKKIFVHAKAYAKNVAIEGVDGDLKLSDNFFDMEAGMVEVGILEGDCQEIRCQSVWDIAKNEK